MEKRKNSKEDIKKCIDGVVKELAKVLEENEQKFMRMEPKFELSRLVNANAAYDSANKLLVVNEDAESANVFFKASIGSVLASYYFEKKFYDRYKGYSRATEDDMNKYAIENVVKNSFAILFSDYFIEKYEKGKVSAKIVENIFSNSELNDKASLKGLGESLYSNIKRGAIGGLFLNFYNSGDTDAISLLSRVLGLLEVITSKGDVQKALVNCYYKGAGILDSIKALSQAEFEMFIENAFTENAM